MISSTELGISQAFQEDFTSLYFRCLVTLILVIPLKLFCRSTGNDNESQYVVLYSTIQYVFICHPVCNTVSLSYLDCCLSSLSLKYTPIPSSLLFPITPTISHLHLVTMQIYLSRLSKRTGSSENVTPTSVPSNHTQPPSPKSPPSRLMDACDRNKLLPSPRQSQAFTLPLQKTSCQSLSSCSPVDIPAFKSPIKSPSQYFQICYWMGYLPTPLIGKLRNSSRCSQNLGYSIWRYPCALLVCHHSFTRGLKHNSVEEGGGKRWLMAKGWLWGWVGGVGIQWSIISVEGK